MPVLTVTPGKVLSIYLIPTPVCDHPCNELEWRHVILSVPQYTTIKKVLQSVKLGTDGAVPDTVYL